jgi:hypothetical protein
MASLSKLPRLAGVALTAIGGVAEVREGRGGDLPPGDLAIRKGAMCFHLPHVTCRVIRLLLSLMAGWSRR